MPDRKLVLAVVCAALAGCGASSQPCKAALSATFETVPNGPLPADLVLGGISLTDASAGTVTVLRDQPEPGTFVPVLYLANQARVVALPGCDAHAVELSYNDSEGRLSIQLFAADAGGGSGQDGGDAPPSYSVDSSALSSTPETNPGYKHAVIMIPGGGTIRRLELLGTSDDPTHTVGAFVRLVGFDQ